MSTSLADEQLFDHQLCGRPLQAAARHRKIHQIDPQTGAVLRTIETDRIITGMTWVAGELRRGTWQDESSDVGHIDPETEKVFERLEMPDGTVASGHESDGVADFLRRRKLLARWMPDRSEGYHGVDRATFLA